MLAEAHVLYFLIIGCEVAFWIVLLLSLSCATCWAARP